MAQADVYPAERGPPHISKIGPLLYLSIVKKGLLMLRIYNTLTRRKEDFQTLEPNVVKMYVCGVTVYDDAHAGHAMSALVFDVIRRYLEYRGYNVRHVMNYTDVDDKIINRAKQLGEDPLKLSQRYIEDYTKELARRNILPATSYPQVSRP